MDIFAMIYYAAVCGVLSVGVKRQRAWTRRLGIGAVVGLIAAAALPIVRTLVAV